MRLRANSRADGGLLFRRALLTSPAGTVVHINAAVAGLVGAFLIGKRVGYGRESIAPQPDLPRSVPRCCGSAGSASTRSA